MPEGHSIHRLAHAFADGFGGQQLEVTSPQGRFAAGAALLDGGTLETSDAWGKHLFLGVRPPAGATTDELRYLHVHLGLYGAWTFAGDAAFAGPHAIGAPRVRIAEEERPMGIDPALGNGMPDGGANPGQPAAPGEWVVPPPRGQVRVRIVGEHGVADLAGPTRCEVLDEEGRSAVVRRLGPDPLRPDPDGEGEETFVRAVRGSRVGAGVQLMDQSVLAGVGNIYRAELLFRARVHPLRPGAGLAVRTVRGIWRDAVDLMADGVAIGRIVTTRPEDREVPDDRWYVYHRDGGPCLLCSRTVQAADLAGRRVYWCPGCQRMR